MPGHGFLITKYPPLPSGTGFPSSSTTSASIPGSALVADPGFKGATGSGEIKCIPVSVCHQVSIIGHCSLPTFL